MKEVIKVVFKGKKEVWDPNCEYFCRYESRTCKKTKRTAA